MFAGRKQKIKEIVGKLEDRIKIQDFVDWEVKKVTHQNNFSTVEIFVPKKHKVGLVKFKITKKLTFSIENENKEFSKQMNEYFKKKRSIEDALEKMEMLLIENLENEEDLNAELDILEGSIQENEVIQSEGYFGEEEDNDRIEMLDEQSNSMENANAAALQEFLLQMEENEETLKKELKKHQIEIRKITQNQNKPSRN